ADSPGTFAREHVRLNDVLRDLGLPAAALRSTVNQSAHSDIRTANAPGVYAVIRSEVRDDKGRIVAKSLDKLDSICSVRVALKQLHDRKYIKTDGAPTLRIKAVEPDSRSELLHVILEVSTTGKKPLAIPHSDFQSRLTGKGLPTYSGFGLVFPEDTSKV